MKSPIECLRKRNSQIRFHKKYIGRRNTVEFHKIKVTNSTLFSNFVERLHELIPPPVLTDRSNILWKIDSAFASPLPLTPTIYGKGRTQNVQKRSKNVSEPGTLQFQIETFLNVFKCCSRFPNNI